MNAKFANFIQHVYVHKILCQICIVVVMTNIFIYVSEVKMNVSRTAWNFEVRLPKRGVPQTT